MLNENYIQENIEGKYDLKKEFFKYLFFWRWFVLSIIICFIISLFYIRYSHDIYNTSAKIKILDKQSATLELPSASDFFSNDKINLENEIELLSSYSILNKVINKLNLNASFFNVGDITSKRTVTFPFDFEQLISNDSINEDLIFDISYHDNVIKIKDINKDTIYLFKSFNTYTIPHNLPFNIQCSHSSAFKHDSYKVIFSNTKNTVNQLKKNISISKVGKESDIIKIDLANENSKYSESIINTLVDIFNKDGIDDRQMIFKRTIDFVNERYIMLSNELDSIEIQKQLYKLNNNLINITANSSLSLELSSKSNQQLLDLENQIAIAKLLNESFKNKNYDLLPANIGINNTEINFMISNFNAVILERKNLIISAGLNNPSVQQLDRTINDGRKNIIRTVNNYLTQLKQTKKQLILQSRKLSVDVSSLPEKEKILRAIERNQIIKESLYLFLLQKREEAEVSFAVTEPSIKVIEYALTSDIPISAGKIITFLTALLIGTLIPFGSIYLILLFNTKIQLKQDIDELNIGATVIGELPFIADEESKLFKNPKDRNTLAESFRILSSNVNYLLPQNTGTTDAKVIISTSSVKGEGKSFVALNISLALSSLDKKVLLIGADLRNPQLHKYLGIDKSQEGLTSYLHNTNFDWKASIINKFEHLPKHHTLLTGIIPPNATQLLANGNFEKIILEAKKDYDYIIIDTAPTLLVTDTLLISDNADAVMYICRSNYTEKEILNYPKELIRDGKIKNVGIVINSVGANARYDYGYSYKYGYSYNYGYGYGYGSTKED
ncbi:MAG: capsular exopolysaccharide synthesis family protein [Flavobacteriales bacterium]|jgi:capsular exopolysaccharide synthesis family protein